MKNGKVYLYSRYRGRFDVYEGELRPYGYSKGMAAFEYKRGNKGARLVCSPNPGEVYHGVVWLPEKDDAKALEIFIEHERLAIQELKDKIEHHEWNIEQLRSFAKNTSY